MGCTGSKGVDHGSTAHHTQQAVPQQQVYGIPQQSLPPSTLPQGWISQWDPTKQRLYYVYPQTGQVTWAHPLGPGADAQEMQRFYQIQSMQQQQHGGHNRTSFTDSYNRGGGFGPGAGMAMGLMAGKCGAMGLMAGSVLAGGMGGGYGGDMIPADATYTGGDFGGGDFGGGDFGGGDFGF
ncbi:hypothetical protein BGZ51_006551 [Haplosporangium sp. Z 767]|nr:hypothetical protein BGZ51_006551 [Haplosporangium sp. Z 767]KAF9180435.1 hypothetical protein BGZ50_006240 [Haplosporangium sp. Z 11]